MRRVDLALQQAVAHARPRMLAREFELDAVLVVQPEHGRHHEGRAIRQGHEAGPDHGLFRPVRAGDECVSHRFLCLA
jgi:hypothetical protein